MNKKIVAIVIVLLTLVACSKDKTYAIININEKVEIEINKENKVLTINGINNNLFDNINSSDLEEVINQTVDILYKNNYIDNEIVVKKNITDIELDFILNQYLTNKVALIDSNISINIGKTN